MFCLQVLSWSPLPACDQGYGRMKYPLILGLFGSALLLSGCQSFKWTAKNKSPSDTSLAQSENIREEPWTWRKKKPKPITELPPELAQKLEESKRPSVTPKTVEEWIAQGSEQETARNFSAAKKAYEEALALDPVNPVAHHRLGILADMRKEYGEAEDHYQAALREKPHEVNLLSDLGYSHYLRGNVQQSKKYLLQALDIDHQHKQALKILGTLYASQGWYDDAVLAFRHYRPEAEAQQLLARYFPNGRPAPNTDIALAGAQNTAPPMPPDVDTNPGNIRGMTQEEIMQMAKQERLTALQQREQKMLAEMRPQMQESMSQNTANSQFPAAQMPAYDSETPEWARDSVDPSSSMALNSQANPQSPMQMPPDNSSPNFQSAQSTENAWPSQSSMVNNTQPMPRSSSTTTAQNLPFWSGNGTPAHNVTQQPANNWPSNTPMNSSPGGAMAQSPWPSQGASRVNIPSNLQNSVAPDQYAASNQYSQWNGNPPDVSQPKARTQVNLQSLNRQAYQLGMSTGPGTMFPSMAANPWPAPTPVNDAFSDAGSPGSQWETVTTSNGYPETKPTTGWNQNENAADNFSENSANSSWQTAPTQPMPNSPAGSWNQPNAVPWPGNSSTQFQSTSQGASNTSYSPNSQQAQMPTITPGTSPWGNANPGAGMNSNTFSQTGTEADQSANANGTGVVPAWYNSPGNNPQPVTRIRGNSANGTTVPQWPYAPK